MKISKSVDNIRGTPRCTPSRDILNEKENAIIVNISQDKTMISGDRNSLITDGDSLTLVGEGLDLTEAEHYALYTVMAPHATQSEFDEMSCYYAAVEGGKILS
uniref:Embryonic polarity protein dorsal-like isoform X1 n=2 Tax=Harmonia axyridis TaxID=115357 RepID=A0A1X9IUA4_HARAX|nr:embryonic polarity protein dorsal-like isoform X1 [Harmonia axyridis]